MKSLQWFTTQANPRRPATGYDAGQTGWKLHTFFTDKSQFHELKGSTALCGLRPPHGWSLDLFIQDKCLRCMSKALGLGWKPEREDILSVMTLTRILGPKSIAAKLCKKFENIT